MHNKMKVKSNVVRMGVDVNEVGKEREEQVEVGNCPQTKLNKK